jgi:N-acetylglucosaminyl-diphospho-decaprenol L-rhamnosyltransferase
MGALAPVTPAPVAVAVVSANAAHVLGDCLDSLLGEHEAGRAEVWVVDNASTDGAPELVAERYPWVTLVASKENMGFSKAINLVAERTTSPWIATANDDIALEPGALATLLATGEADPRIGMVVPRLILPDGSTQDSIYAFPSPLVAATVDLGLGRLSPRLAERACVTWDPERARTVPWALAAFGLVRRTAFDQVGGFDKQQWMYAEDLDLGWRLQRAGFTTRYEPQARVLHYGGASTEKAFGDNRTARRMAATYSWVARRRGVPVAWTTAGISWAAWATRAAVTRDERARFWRDIHRLGLKGRETLLKAP